jgi:hypothetical protein
MKQISFATNESKHLKNKHERERSKTKSLGSERLDKKKKLGGIVFQKIGGVLSKNKKGLKGHLSCLRFRRLLGAEQNRHERRKTCTRRNAKVTTRTWNNHSQITPKLGAKKTPSPKKIW